MLLAVSIIIAGIAGIIFLNMEVDTEYNNRSDNPTDNHSNNYSDIINTNKTIHSEYKETERDQYLFSWDDIPGNDSEFIDCLEGGLKISWAKNAKITKSGDRKTITVIHSDDIESITIDNKNYDGDFVAIDGTYMFEIEGPIFSEYLTFNIDKVPGKHSGRILKFLEDNLKLDWVNAKISKSSDGKNITITNDENSLMLKINNEENKTILEINGVKTYEYVSKNENGELKIYVPSREQGIRGIGAEIKVKLPNGTEDWVYAVESLDDYWWGTELEKSDNYYPVEIGISDTTVRNIGIYVSDVSITIKDFPARAYTTADLKVYDMQGENAILFKLSEDEDKVILKIGGKVTQGYNVKNETGKLNIYN